jgi:lipoprotein signal peptidase
MSSIATRKHPFLWMGALAAVVALVADQTSKAWILYGLGFQQNGDHRAFLPNLSLTMEWNRGITFGMLNGGSEVSYMILALGALAVVVALCVWLLRAESRITSIAIGAVAGGAIGNIIDRLRFGAVVDFLHFHVGSFSWYIFNVADAAIVCGVAALVIEGLLPAARTPAGKGYPANADPPE